MSFFSLFLSNISIQDDNNSASQSAEVKQKLMLVAQVLRNLYSCFLFALIQQRRTTIILASMVLLFGITWLPHNIVTLVMEYNTALIGEPNMYLITMTAHL